MHLYLSILFPSESTETIESWVACWISHDDKGGEGCVDGCMDGWMKKEKKHLMQSRLQNSLAEGLSQSWLPSLY